ncbi:hypothetical protein GCM10010361_00150 [Streptomyces olivaceiscleroticus]|uniref:Integral membrane protein n=1 Tax=Streptomyces olivaceiscleroticus TaxID=68245 RepID=A0ABP3J3D2_9ACTN
MLFSAVATVCWTFLAMTGLAALGLHLLGADAYGSLGPMTAAVMVLAVGGTVTPHGAVSAFGVSGVTAETAIDIVPLGVSVLGALLLGLLFLRSLRAVPGGVTWSGLAARGGAVAALFTALVGGLAWAGHDSVTIPARRLIPGPAGGGGGPLDRLPDLPGLSDLPGLGDLGDLPGLGDLGGLSGLALPGGLARLADARLRVDFAVAAGPSLVAGALWVLGVLLIALAASRRTPLPHAAAGADRVVRPAASALTQVLLVAVLIGLAAGLYGVTEGGQPLRALGAALLGAPNGAWLALTLGLLVPWYGSAGGALLQVLPASLRELLGGGGERPVTLSRLAEQTPSVWAAALVAMVLMLAAGVLTAMRTARTGTGVMAYAGGCALRLGTATALALPLLVRLTEASVAVRLNLFGIGAHETGLGLRGSLGTSAVLGALWGGAAGLAGALLAAGTGLAGRRAATPPVPAHRPPSGSGGGPGPYTPSRPYRQPNPDTNPYLRTLPPHEPEPREPERRAPEHPGPERRVPPPPAGPPPGASPPDRPPPGVPPPPDHPPHGSDTASAPTVSGTPLPRPGWPRPRPKRRWDEPPPEPPPPGRPGAGR